MSEINEYYNYGVAQKAEGKWLIYRILLIAAYVLLPVGALTLMMFGETWMVFFGALLAFSDFLLAFLTWRFVSFDYEYETISGKVTFSIIRNAFNHRRKKEIMSFMIRDCVAIAPLDNPEHPECAEQYKAYGAETVYNALSCKNAEDAYFAIFEDEKGKKCAFLFQATGEMLKRCRWYNKEGTVVTKTRI